MDCSCQEVEVYNYLTNSTLVLEVCNSAAHCHYLSAAFTTIAVALMFSFCCIACVGANRKPRVVYTAVPVDTSVQQQPPNYETI